MAANPLRDLIEELAADREPEPPGTATVGTFIGLLRRFGYRTFEAETWGGNYNLEIRNVRHDGSYVLGDLKVTDTVSRAFHARPRFQRPRINFTATRTINELGKKLNEMTGDESWIATLEELCVMLLEQFEAKGEHNVVKPVSQEQRGWPYVLDSLIPDRAVSCIMAHGGQGKTMTADLIAVALATGQSIGPFKPLTTGPVLIADWEHKWDFHAARISRICESLGIDVPPNIHHFRPMNSSPITKCVDEIIETVEREGIVWVAVDSIGFAAGGDLNSSEVATNATNALKDIPCATTFLAHVSKNIVRKGSRQEAAPTGSTFFWNAADVLYELRQDEQLRQDGATLFGMKNPKANVGQRLQRPVGWLLWFDDPGGPITCKEEEIMGGKPGGESLPLYKQIADVLTARGKQSVNELALVLSMTSKGQKEKVRDMCEQMAGKGYLVKWGEGERIQFGIGTEPPKRMKEGPPQASFATTEPEPEDAPGCHCGGVVWMYGPEGQPLCEEHAT